MLVVIPVFSFILNVKLAYKPGDTHFMCRIATEETVREGLHEGLDGGGVWYSLFVKKLAHYSSHSNFGLFIKIRPIIH